MHSFTVIDNGHTVVGHDDRVPKAAGTIHRPQMPGECYQLVCGATVRTFELEADALACLCHYLAYGVI